MDLRTNPRLEDFMKISEEFSIDVDVDLLFEEFVKLSSFLENLPENFSDFKIDQQWVYYFKTNKSPNYYKICSYVFSLPHSNAMCERIFSLMFTAWRKDRNSLSIETLESELMIKHNFTETCQEFVKFLEKDGKNILGKVGTSLKYF